MGRLLKKANSLKSTTMIIFGIHSCENAITSGKHKISKIYLQDGKPVPSWIPVNLKIYKIEEKDIKKMVPRDAVHQGIAVEIDESSYYGDITDFASKKESSCVCILDGVVDPHNLGAIIRTAAAFNVAGIIVSEKGSCKLTGTVIKASSGGIEHVNVCVVKNLASAIEKLQSYGFWAVSFCERGEKFIHNLDLRGKICLIFGAEGTGIRRLQKDKSDFIVKLPTSLNFPTLNVSNAAAIAFYEVAKQNSFCLS